MTTPLHAYAWLPEGTIGIGNTTPPGAFMIAVAPQDKLYDAIKVTACRNADGCYSLPGITASTGTNPRFAVTAFIAYRKTIRACLGASRDTLQRGRQGTSRRRLPLETGDPCRFDR
jgi:hypothetical protein